MVQGCPCLVVCLRLQCLRQSQFHYLLPALFAKGLLGWWRTMGGSRAEARPPHKFKRFLTIANSEYCKQNQVKIGGSRVAAEGGGVCRGPPIFLRCIFVASLRLLWHGCVLLPGGKITSRRQLCLMSLLFGLAILTSSITSSITFAIARTKNGTRHP